MTLAPATARRLAFIRYLHRLADAQAQLPDPQSAVSLLMLHDAVESLLLLVADHYSVSSQKFEDYWKVLDPRVPGGLTGFRGMQRLHRSRNDFKHNGVVPSSSTITLAGSDAATFMSATVQAAFGVDYTGVSMVDVVSQTKVRAELRAAEVEHAGGKTRLAMVKLRDAVNELFDPHRGARDLSWTMPDRSPFAFGPDMWRSVPAHEVKQALEGLLGDGRVTSTGRRVAAQVAGSVESARLMRPAMRMVALGLDFPTYLRFDLLVPHLIVSLNGKRTYMAPKGYAPTDEEFSFCLEFVVTAALRLAAAEAHQQEPAWLTRDPSGRVTTEVVHEVPAPSVPAPEE
ncbi:hypothetical protein AB0C04_28100 [Micromonospora sp. NPDC048909]|uniref:hypothetical protein n=1 Tax=Micromonospora sp. NPDC048909 TaxID=3155643 RepID=UPI00340C64DB